MFLVDEYYCQHANAMHYGVFVSTAWTSLDGLGTAWRIGLTAGDLGDKATNIPQPSAVFRFYNYDDVLSDLCFFNIETIPSNPASVANSSAVRPS